MVLAPGTRTSENDSSAVSEERWPSLYDPAQLARNAVPCVAAVYAEDMYVHRALSERTAASIAGMKLWLTNEYEHSGLRTSNGAVFERLLALRRELV